MKKLYIALAILLFSIPAGAENNLHGYQIVFKGDPLEARKNGKSVIGTMMLRNGIYSQWHFDIEGEDAHRIDIVVNEKTKSLIHKEWDQNEDEAPGLFMVAPDNSRVVLDYYARGSEIRGFSIYKPNGKLVYTDEYYTQIKPEWVDETQFTYVKERYNYSQAKAYADIWAKDPEAQSTCRGNDPLKGKWMMYNSKTGKAVEMDKQDVWICRQ